MNSEPMNSEPMNSEPLTTEQCVDRALSIITTSLTSDDKERPHADALHHIVLTGGGAGVRVTSRLHEVAKELDPELWSRVHIWWGDERFVASESQLRNDHGIEQSLGNYYIAGNVHRAPSTEQCQDVYQAAQVYSNELTAFGTGNLTTPLFDVVLLGLGPDGHVASLFPYSQLLTSVGICFGLEHSPKPPPERITMSFSTLNCTLVTVILASGEEKNQARQRLSAPSGSIEETPARGVSAPELFILG